MTATELREKATAFLAADPRIAAFTITEAGDGLSVRAKAAASWFVSQRAAAYQAICGGMLQKWQMVYDRSYRWDRTIRAPNFEAWVSSFTNEPIPVPQMQTWLDDVLSQLRSVPHARVLDIGCGVGLVLAALAPGGAAYEGIDFSQEAIDSLRAWVATQDALRHVRLVQGAAHELDSGLASMTDLALLNSTVQYFPDADYLVRVLQVAAGQVLEAGALFLGDLRASALLPMRAANVAAARVAAGATAGELRADAETILALGREFAIDPAFFDTLGAALPRRIRAGFSLKPAAADRELAGYRYDALLRLDQPELAPAPAVNAADMKAASLDAVIAHLDADRPDAVALAGLPNARLTKDAALTHALQAASADMPVKDLMSMIDAEANEAIEPDAIAQAARSRGYAVELRFTPGAPDGRFDALLCRTGVAARWPDAAQLDLVTNDPLGAELASKLRLEVRSALEATLGGVRPAHLELAMP